MEMLHPSDASLIGLCSVCYQTKMSVVCDGKTEMYYILFGPSRSRYRIPLISEAYKDRTAGFCLEQKKLIYGFGKTNLARLHPKF